MNNYNLEICPLPFLSVQIVYDLLKELGVSSYTINYHTTHSVLQVKSQNILTVELDKIIDRLKKECFSCKNILKLENNDGN